jgi:hypothetical protein
MKHKEEEEEEGGSQEKCVRRVDADLCVLQFPPRQRVCVCILFSPCHVKKQHTACKSGVRPSKGFFFSHTQCLSSPYTQESPPHRNCIREKEERKRNALSLPRKRAFLSCLVLLCFVSLMILTSSMVFLLI